MTSDVKAWLISKVSETETRMANAKADYDSACRMLAMYEAEQPAPVAAPTEDIRKAAIEVLNGHNEPIHRQVIYEEMIAMGICINGKDPVASLGTILSRCAEDFRSHGNGVWGLKKSLLKPPSQNGPADVGLVVSR